MLKEFSITVDADHAEALADALLEAGALSVATEDADAGLLSEQALFGEPGFEPPRAAWPRSRLVVLLGEHAQPESLLATASEALFPGQAIPAMTDVRTVHDTDWVRQTQAQFAPVRISSELWIVPSWHEPPQEAAHIIRLDPGVAFGTGSHPTTQLCLQWLEANRQPGQSVLDYGCGSGVLAIAASLLGAGRVVGVDIDPQAVQAAQDNAWANVPKRMDASHNGASIRFCLPEALDASLSFDVVVANILANPLQVLAPALIARLKPGGVLVLSGILTRQAQEVIDAYGSVDPTLRACVWREHEGWVCITAQRSAAVPVSIH